MDNKNLPPPANLNLLNSFNKNNKIAVTTVVYKNDETLLIDYQNDGFTALTGFNKSDLHLISSNFLNIIPNEYAHIIKDLFNKQFQANQSYSLTYKLTTKDNSPCFVNDYGYMFLNNNQEKCATLILINITKLKTEKNEADYAKERLKIGLKSSKICIFEVDLTMQLYTCFENAESIFGISGEKILSDVTAFSSLSADEYQSAASNYFSHPDDTSAISKAFESIYQGLPASYEARMKAGNTKFTWCRVNVTPIIENGVPVRMVGVITDINDIKLKSDQFKVQATQDLFTGLYNKKHCEMIIKDIIKNNPTKNHALIICDIDDFKTINDTYGHDFGDEIILNFSNQLKSIFSSSEIIGRFGGDEFIVFIPVIVDIANLHLQLKCILNNNKNPASISMGVSIFPSNGKDYKTLLANADKALYRAKATKNTYVIYK